jgi:hypothetical protein
MSEEEYRIKYLKYKNKYIDLKREEEALTYNEGGGYNYNLGTYYLFANINIDEDLNTPEVPGVYKFTTIQTGCVNKEMKKNDTCNYLITLFNNKAYMVNKNAVYPILISTDNSNETKYNFPEEKYSVEDITKLRKYKLELETFREHIQTFDNKNKISLQSSTDQTEPYKMKSTFNKSISTFLSTLTKKINNYKHEITKKYPKHIISEIASINKIVIGNLDKTNIDKILTDHLKKVKEIFGNINYNIYTVNINYDIDGKKKVYKIEKYTLAQGLNEKAEQVRLPTEAAKQEQYNEAEKAE